MIELALQDRCTGCGDCVTACPCDVLEQAPDGRAVIARQTDCQTCFLCELYCPADALYVGPDSDEVRPVDAAAIEASGLLGQFRRESGWGEWADRYKNEHWRMGEIFERARVMAMQAAPSNPAEETPDDPSRRIRPPVAG